jgi:hypothetical protein
VLQSIKRQFLAFSHKNSGIIREYCAAYVSDLVHMKSFNSQVTVISSNVTCSNLGTNVSHISARIRKGTNVANTANSVVSDTTAFAAGRNETHDITELLI